MKNKPIIDNIERLLLNNKTPDPNSDFFVKNYKNNIINENKDNFKKLSNDIIKCDKLSKSKTTPYLFVNKYEDKKPTNVLLPFQQLLSTNKKYNDDKKYPLDLP